MEAAPQEVQEEAPRIDVDDRIKDPLALDMFRQIGYERLSPNMVKIFNEFKVRRDAITPGRLTAGEMAFVAVLADIKDGKISLGG